MARVLGIDPGAEGAFVLINSLNPYSITHYVDMPVRVERVGKTDRKRLDFLRLQELLEGDYFEPELGKIDLVVLEDPGARPAQAGQMAFGRSLGAVEYALFRAMYRVENPTPAVWKRVMKAPKDKEQSTIRAEELFVEDRTIFRGPRGGKKDGRAEAAMLALYGVKHLL